MDNLNTMLNLPWSFKGLKITQDHLYIASTIITPLVLLFFLPVASVFILTMLALCGVTIAIFHIKKDRDSARHYLQICKEHIHKEKKRIHEHANHDSSQPINCSNPAENTASQNENNLYENNLYEEPIKENILQQEITRENDPTITNKPAANPEKPIANPDKILAIAPFRDSDLTG